MYVEIGCLCGKLFKFLVNPIKRGLKKQVLLDSIVEVPKHQTCVGGAPGFGVRQVLAVIKSAGFVGLIFIGEWKLARLIIDANAFDSARSTFLENKQKYIIRKIIKIF